MTSVVHVSGGLIHDWIGAVSIPDTTVAKTLARVQDYDNHKNIYKPEVMDSRLISHHGNDFTIFLAPAEKENHHRGVGHRARCALSAGE